MDKTSLGDRMKGYEKLHSPILLPRVPAVARLDGRRFSRFTKSLTKPHDLRFQVCMWKTLENLVKESGAVCGYTQSDEISLVFSDEKPPYFEGKVNKINSILASFCTVRFSNYVQRYLPSHIKTNPTFDCRVWSVPDRQEAVNALIWREQDATRNAIMGLGQAFYSHKQLHKKNSSQIQDMLMLDHNINFNDMPSSFKRGVYVRRKMILKPSPDSKTGWCQRHKIEWETLPRLASLENRVEVVFKNADPIVRSE